MVLFEGKRTHVPMDPDDDCIYEEEYFEVSKESANLINGAKRLFVSGTTALKCLESCEWEEGKLGRKYNLGSIRRRLKLITYSS